MTRNRRGLTIRVFHEGESDAVAVASLETDLRRDSHPLGGSYDIQFDQSFAVEKGTRYRVDVTVDASSGDVIGSGSVVLTEGDWDNRVTGTQTCQLPDDLTLSDRPASGLVGIDDCYGTQAFWSLINSYDQIMSFPVDNRTKYEHILRSLEIGDYLTIASNRFYDTETRNPTRWPLTTLYYEKLFAGELGFELVAVFDEPFELGPWRVSDQHLPIYESPAWLNEIEADEAFHVYDHPAVFIFRKSEDYSRALVEAALASVSLKQVQELTPWEGEAQLLGVQYWTSYQADPVPTALTFPAADYQTQTSGGTWSARFFSDSPVNSNQLLGLMSWYLLLLVIRNRSVPIGVCPVPKYGGRGIRHQQADRSAASRLVRLGIFDAEGTTLVAIRLNSIPVGIGHPQRDSGISKSHVGLTAFLRANWKRLAWMEIIALLAFLFMIVIRLTNPDLWHPFKGGEKPMNFAYLNGVLRSTTFPPIDPWFAGGFINYYYFGYVLVGVPALLLGIMPSFAYNLMIPTIFSLTGSGAFSAAYTIVSRWYRREPGKPERSSSPAKRMGNPWFAGIMALLMCILLGNLDTIRVLGKGVAELGGYHTPEGLVEFLIEEYRDQHGRLPAADIRDQLVDQAAQSNLVDNCDTRFTTRYRWSAA